MTQEERVIKSAAEIDVHVLPVIQGVVVKHCIQIINLFVGRIQQTELKFQDR